MNSFFSKIALSLLFLLVSFAGFLAQVTNPNGYNKFFYENGKLSSEGTMKDGKPDGYWKNYYKNGNLKIEGNRRNFLLDSVWKFYDERGRISKTISYKTGKKNGSTKVYDTLQKLTFVEEYVDDLKDGFSRTFYKNGKTKNIVRYVKGRQEGNAYEYSQDSLITAISIYKGGILQGYEKINQKDENNKKQGIWKEFYGDNSVKKEMRFNDDSLDGYVKEFDKKGSLLSTKKFNNGKPVLRAPEIANVELFRETFEDGTLKYEGVYSDGLPIGTHFKYKKKIQCDSMYFPKNDSAKTMVAKLICRNNAIPDSAIDYFDGVVIAKGAVDSARNRIGIWTEYHHTGEFKGKGTYREGNRTGDWEFYYASGKLEQKGRYDKKGRTQGVWKWYYESGALLREENYLNGNRNGEMTDYDEQGKIILKGNYIENKMEGPWIYETPDYLEYSSFSNDEADSLWKSYYMPGKRKRFEGKFVAGEPVGWHVMFHPNGSKQYEGNYISGMRDGDWKFYNEYSFNYLTITYKNDIEIKWQGQKIYPTYEEGLKRYNVKVGENKTQTIRK
ncbi:MAG: hypothetical protein IT236_02825 [Bacteroidia bacterium]|nr:hypothetical protein [Bacteroidia bacterium]